MSGRRRLGLVAAAATVMAAAPISTIYASWTWLIQCVIAVGVVCGAATAARSLRAPVWVQALAMAAGLLLITTWIFRSGDEFLGLLPSPETFAHFAALSTQAVEDMRGSGTGMPYSASVASRSWSTCSRSACAGPRWPVCRCWRSTRCRSRSTRRASPRCRS